MADAVTDQIVGSLLSADEIFAGLVDFFIVPRKYQSTLASIINNSSWFIGGSAQGVDFDSAFLSGAGAMDPATLAAQIGGVFSPGAVFGIAYNQMILDGDPHQVFMEVDMQTSDTFTDAMTDLKDVIAMARAGSGSPGSKNGRIYSSNLGSTLAEIGTAVTAKYAAATNSTDTLTLTSAADAVGNAYDVDFFCYPGMPTIPLMNSSLEPIAAGIKRAPYVQEGGVKINSAGTQQTVKAVQSYRPVKQYASDTAESVTFTGLQDDNLVAIQMAAGLTARSSAGNYHGALLGHRRTFQEFGMIITVDSKRTANQKDLIVLPRVTGLGTEITRNTVNGGFNVTLTLQPIQGRQDTVAIYQRRPTYI